MVLVNNCNPGQKIPNYPAYHLHTWTVLRQSKAEVPGHFRTHLVSLKIGINLKSYGPFCFL
uniref:Uncharacterized protein n=1 Tax=Rhizophora mucronata TaxID=61149 RepID=A0A2P2NMC4_RHIMU